jgi:hemerythrin superfamily protein
MNVIELLKKDHQTVSELFKSFESAKEAEQKDVGQQIARQICQELTVHATVEEELFYPAVDAKAQGQDDEYAEDKVKEADEEHRLVKALVGEIEGMKASDGHFAAKVKVLKDVVEHHVEEEEGELMPKAKKLLSKEELEEIGAEVEARKEELKAAGGRPAKRSAGRTRSSVRRAPALSRRASSRKKSSRTRGRSGR